MHDGNIGLLSIHPFIEIEDLVVLKPVKAVTYYKNGQQTKEVLPDLLEGAVSYYQHASHWRDLYKNASKDSKSR